MALLTPLPTRIGFRSPRSDLRRRTDEEALRLNLEEGSGSEETRRMGVTKQDVEAALTSAMNPSHLQVVDTSGGCGASFEIEIVSEQFEGKRLLERHRLVNTVLAEQLKHIHALSIKKALSPAQWSPPPPQPEAAAEPSPASTAEA